jgi:hypothetical protein
MTVTKTQLKELTNKITCMVNQVESGQGIFYYGTDKGQVCKYNNITGVITVIKELEHEIMSMSLYSNKLYIGLANGTFVSLTTS